MRKPPGASTLARWAPLAAILSIAALATVSWWLARDGDDPAAGFRLLWQNAIWTVPLALGLHLAVQAMGAVRLRITGFAMGVRLSPWKAQRVVTAGLFAGAATPMRAGAEPMRAALLRRDGVSWPVIGRLVLTDRLYDVSVYLVLGLVAALLYPRLAQAEPWLSWLAWGGLTLLLGATAFVLFALLKPHMAARPISRILSMVDRIRRRPPQARHDKIHDSLKEVRTGVVGFVRHHPATVATGLTLSLLMRISEASVIFVLLRALGIEVDFVAVFLASVLLVLVAVVPITPGGAGVVEPAAILLLAPVAPEIGAAFLVSWRLLTFHADLVLGGLVAASALHRRKPLPPTPS